MEERRDANWACLCLGRIFWNTVQQTLTYTSIHSSLWTHTRTPYPMSIFAIPSRHNILRLTKSSPRLRRKLLLPLKTYYRKAWNIFRKMRAPMLNLRFELWWVGDTTIHLTNSTTGWFTHLAIVITQSTTLHVRIVYRKFTDLGWLAGYDWFKGKNGSHPGENQGDD